MASSITGAGQTGYLHIKYLSYISISHRVYNSKGFSIRPDTMKLIKEKVRVIFELIDTGKIFNSSGSIDIKTNNWQKGSPETKNCYTAKTIIIQVRQQSTAQEKYLHLKEG